MESCRARPADSLAAAASDSAFLRSVCSSFFARRVASNSAFASSFAFRNDDSASANASSNASHFFVDASARVSYCVGEAIGQSNVLPVKR